MPALSMQFAHPLAQTERKMLPSALLLAIGGALLVADGVPALDVEPGCRAAAKMGDSLSLDSSLRQCLADEKGRACRIEKAVVAVLAGPSPTLC